MINLKIQLIMGALVILVSFVVHIPALFLDIFIVINLVFALLILLIVLKNQKTVEFSMLPTVLLASTVQGLSANIMTARLILLDRPAFDDWLITPLSRLLAGSGGIYPLVIWTVLFTVLLSIDQILITKGAVRTMEVMARITFDVLPGKQMAIDTEYSTGKIDQDEANAKKEALQMESDFYGAMDGTGKFISGYAKFRIVIILAVFVGGLLIGTLLRDEPVIDAVKLYTSLAMGSGLFFLVHSFLLSLAAGIAITRTVHEEYEKLCMEQ